VSIFKNTQSFVVDTARYNLALFRFLNPLTPKVSEKRRALLIAPHKTALSATYLAKGCVCVCVFRTQVTNFYIS